MTQEKAYEAKILWEEIKTLEGLTEDDSFHSLEYLAKRLHEANRYNFPNTASKLNNIEKTARKLVQMEIGMLIEDLNKKLEQL